MKHSTFHLQAEARPANSTSKAKATWLGALALILSLGVSITQGQTNRAVSQVPLTTSVATTDTLLVETGSVAGAHSTRRISVANFAAQYGSTGGSNSYATTAAYATSASNLLGSVTLAQLPAAVVTNGNDFSFVVFPDTQYGVANYTANWYAMCAWVTNNKALYNIKEAVSVGDLVDQTIASQLTVASNGMTMLLSAGIPVCFAPGNHDKDALSSINPYLITNYNNYMPQSFWMNVAGGWTGGFENPTNVAGMYNIVTNNGVGYLFIATGWVPDTNLMIWTTNVLGANSNCPAFYTTHLFVDDVPVRRRSAVNNLYSFSANNFFENDYTPTYLFPDQQWYNYLAWTHNLVGTFSGHFTSGQNQEYFFDQAVDRHMVTEAYVNYQSAENTGNDMFWELVTVHPAKNSCSVQTLTLNGYYNTVMVQTNETYSFPLYSTAEPPHLSAWQNALTLAAQQGGLLLYLNFDSTNSGGFKDLGPFALHTLYPPGVGNNVVGGGISNAATALVPTELGYSPMFAYPTNYIVVGDRDPFVHLANLTISAWVKIPNPTTMSTNATVVGDYIPLAFSEFWLYATNSGSLVTNIGFVTQDQTNGNPHWLSTGCPNLADGGWHHLAATYAQGVKSVYVDNQLLATVTVPNGTDALFNGVGNLSIGNLISPGAAWPAQTNQFGSNYIDEVKVCNQAWTPDQVSAEYQRVRAIIAASYVTATNVPDLNRGLVFYAPFSEGSGTNLTDHSVNQYDFAITTNILVWTNGVSGSAIWVPSWTTTWANNYMYLTNGAWLDALGPFTASFWICTTTSGGYYLSKFNGGTDGSFYIETTGGGTTLQFTTVNAALNRVNLVATPTQNILDGNWHMITVGCDLVNAYIYVDGAPLASAAQSGKLNSSPAYFGIGQHCGAPNGSPYGPGAIDDIRVYSRWLSAQEIAWLYNLHGDSPSVSTESQMPTGNGGGLTNLNASALTGTILAANLPNPQAFLPIDYTGPYDAATAQLPSSSGAYVGYGKQLQPAASAAVYWTILNWPQFQWSGFTNQLFSVHIWVPTNSTVAWVANVRYFTNGLGVTGMGVQDKQFATGVTACAIGTNDYWITATNNWPTSTMTNVQAAIFYLGTQATSSNCWLIQGSSLRAQ